MRVRSCSLPSKFLSPDVILVHVGCDKHFPHARDHGWRFGNVVNGSPQIAEILCQHCFVYETGLPAPHSLGPWHVRHRADKAETRAGFLHALQSIQKRRIFRSAIGVKEVQLMRQSVVNSLFHDTEKRRDPDSSGEEHCRLGGILMQCEGARCRVNPHRSAELYSFQGAFERCVTHASSEHQLILERSAGDGKRSDVPFGVALRRILQCQVEDACPGLKSNPGSFSKWKAIVPSATSTLFNSLDG